MTGELEQHDDGIRLAPGVVLGKDAVSFEFVKSSGPGGQNVNKRATKARLRVAMSQIPIDAGSKRRLTRIASSHLTENREIIIESSEHRSQRRNRESCLDRLSEMVREALVKPKPRRKTKPSRGAIERRIKAKKERGQQKDQRRKKDW